MISTTLFLCCFAGLGALIAFIVTRIARGLSAASRTRRPNAEIESRRGPDGYVWPEFENLPPEEVARRLREARGRRPNGRRG